jgi:hypothetical protein
VLTYVTQRTEILHAEKHDRQLKLPGSNYCVQLSHTAVRLTEFAIFWSITDFNGERVSKISKACGMATKVTESYFKILKKYTIHF